MLVMQDKHKGFFVFIALGIPCAMLALAVNILLGAIVSTVLLLAAKGTSHDTWADLGQMVDSRVLTVVVLIGGSLIVFAQSIG